MVDKKSFVVVLLVVELLRMKVEIRRRMVNGGFEVSVSRTGLFQALYISLQGVVTFIFNYVANGGYISIGRAVILNIRLLRVVGGIF